MSASQDDQGKLVVQEEGPNGTLFTSGIILIKNGYMSHPYVSEGQTQANDEGEMVESWSIRLLVPKTTHRWIKDIIKVRVEELMEENKIGPQFKIKELAPDKKFIWDGDRRGAKPEEKGMWRIAGRAYQQPTLLGNTRDADGRIERIAPGKAAKRFFYGGAMGSIMIRPWFSSKKGARVTADLKAVQFMGHGTPFGEGAISDDEMDTGGWDTGAAQMGADDYGGL